MCDTACTHLDDREPVVVVTLKLHTADLDSPLLITVHQHVQRLVCRATHLAVLVLQQIHEIEHHLREKRKE